MSTRAQIAIQIGPDEWAHVYVHLDGYPALMLPALERWKPEDILAARVFATNDPPDRLLYAQTSAGHARSAGLLRPAPCPAHPAAPDARVCPSLHVDRMPLGQCGAAEGYG